MTPIQLYTWSTPNGRKASIMLEETGLPYDVRPVDIERGEQRSPSFLQLNPNHKIPVIVDPDLGRTVRESGAILFYLAERSGKLLPPSDEAHSQTLEWAFFQAAHVGPTLGQYWNYTVFTPDKPAAVIQRFEREAHRVLGVLERRLAQQDFLAGPYGIADVMTWPWIDVAVRQLGFDLAPHPALRRWHSAVAGRPAVQRGVRIPVIPGEAQAA